MTDITAIINAINSLKSFGLIGNGVVLLTILIACIIIMLYQKRKIENLKEFIGLWNPSELKK